MSTQVQAQCTALSGSSAHANGAHPCLLNQVLQGLRARQHVGNEDIVMTDCQVNITALQQIRMGPRCPERLRDNKHSQIAMLIGHCPNDSSLHRDH